MKRKMVSVCFVALISIEPVLASDEGTAIGSRAVSIAQKYSVMTRNIKRLDEDFKKLMKQMDAERISRGEIYRKKETREIYIRQQISKTTAQEYDLLEKFSIACSIRAGRPFCQPTGL